MPRNLCTVLACQISCDALTGRPQDIYKTAAFISTHVRVYRCTEKQPTATMLAPLVCVYKATPSVPVTCFRVLHTS